MKNFIIVWVFIIISYILVKSIADLYITFYSEVTVYSEKNINNLNPKTLIQIIVLLLSVAVLYKISFYRNIPKVPAYFVFIIQSVLIISSNLYVYNATDGKVNFLPATMLFSTIYILSIYLVYRYERSS